MKLPKYDINKYDPKRMMAIPAVLFGIALVIVAITFALTGMLTVVCAGVADITITAAVMNLVGIELSLATTAALLMLIGYSVDSNILLTTKVLKRQGKLEEKMEGAFRTGIIMTTTTLAAIIAMFIVAFIGQVPILYNIAAVLIIGLITDIIFTWGFNAGVLRLYLSRFEKPQPTSKQPKKNVGGAKQ